MAITTVKDSIILLLCFMTCIDSILKVVAWNANGISGRWCYLDHLRKTNDIVFVTEHKLFNCELFKLNDDKNWHVYANASDNLMDERHGNTFGQGGIAVYWSNSINKYITALKDISNDRMIILKYNDGIETIFIIGVYLPQQRCRVSNFDRYLSELKEVITTYKNYGNTIVIGDINCHFGSGAGLRTWGKTTPQAKKFQRILYECDMEIIDIGNMGQGPTYTFYREGIGKSYIDHVCVSRNLLSKVISCTIANECLSNTSDHQDIAIHLEMCKLRSEYAEKSNIPPKIAWRNLNAEIIHEKYTLPLSYELNEIEKVIDFPGNLEYNNTREKVEELLKAVIGAIQKTSFGNLPKIKLNKNSKPYWRYGQSSLNELFANKKDAYNKWKMMGRPRDVDNIHYAAYKVAKSEFRKGQKQAQFNYEKAMLEEIDNENNVDNRFIWYIFRKSRGINKQRGVNSIRNEQGIYITDLPDIVNEWACYFEKLLNTPVEDKQHEAFYKSIDQQIDQSVNNYYVDHTFEPKLVTEKEVSDLISQLKTGKACGYDGVDSEHLKYGGPKLISVLSKLFNECINVNIFPEMFKSAMLVPIPKPGKSDYGNKNNYRGITLLTTIGKLYEKVLRMRLTENFESLGIPVTCEIQGAGKSNISSLHTCFLLKEVINKAVNKNGCAYVAFLDIEKAFDKVWQNGLLYKLKNLNIHPKLWQILKDSFQDFQVRVCINSQRSVPFFVTQGVHQGGPLSSFLFQIYIDELLKILQLDNNGIKIYNENIACTAYADDIAMCSCSKKGLQKLVNTAVEYSKKWKFSFNPLKCEVMSFGQNITEPNILINGINLRNVKDCKYLGTQICVKSYYEKPFIEERISEAYKKSWRIKAIGSYSVRINPLTFSRGFWAVVVPSLIYGFCVTGIKDTNYILLDQFQINVAKNIQGLSVNTPSVIALAGVKWMRLSSRIAMESVYFVLSILTLHMSSIYKRILLNGLLEAKQSNYRIIESNFISNFIQQCRKFKMLNEIDKILNQCKLESSINVYKKLTKSNLWNVEKDQWKATILLYKEADLFLNCGLNLENGYRLWKVAKWDVSTLYKVKSMFKFLVINKEKCGFNCYCPEKPTAVHIIFDCPVVEQARLLELSKMVSLMPTAMRNDFNEMLSKEKLYFIYSCMKCEPILEWKNLYIAMIDFVYKTLKNWFENISS